MKQTLVVLGVVGAMAAVSCGSTPTSTAITIVLKQTDAGKTFNVHGGDKVRVELVDTYPVPGSSLVWTVTASPAGLLKAGSAYKSPPGRGSRPGRTDTYHAQVLPLPPAQAVPANQGAPPFPAY